MKSNVLTRWIAALRSDDYEQIRDHLSNGPDKFCALGVLCELYRQDHASLSCWTQNSWTFFDGRDYHTNTPPIKVRTWADLSDDDIVTVQRWNDIEEFSFQQIADLLSLNLNQEPY